MTKDETLKLALEALETVRHKIDSYQVNVCDDVDEAITAIREALAQPEQETVLPGGGHVPAVPVAVYGYCPECGGAGVMRERRPNGDDKCTNGHKYPSSKALAEQPAQQQEPVAHVVIVGDMVSVSTGSNGLKELHKLGDGAPLYTTPPQRKPLTDEQIEELCWTEVDRRLLSFARAIEAAHGIKE